MIGARAGGIPDVIELGKTGVLVNFGSITVLAHALTTLLEQPDYARQLGRAGHAHVLRDLTFRQKYAEAKMIYETAIQEAAST